MKRRILFASPFVTVLACGEATSASPSTAPPTAPTTTPTTTPTAASHRDPVALDAPRGSAAPRGGNGGNNPPAPRPLDRKIITSPRRDGDRLCFTIDAGSDDNVDTHWTGELLGGGKPVPQTAFAIVRTNERTSYACGAIRAVETRNVRLYPPGWDQR
jgi:hypothetical protein